MPTEHGLYCNVGGESFHIDPWRPVPRAIITHGHSDHAVSGCGTYLTSSTGATVLRARLGHSISVQPIDWGTPLHVGDVTISLHPAGHVLGSAQVRVERHRHPGGSPQDDGGVWCVSGDYFTRAEHLSGTLPTRPGVEPFEPVPCNTFLTESTFGLPIYRWPSDDQVFCDLNSWWRSNAANDITSIIYGYALGKAQRILMGLDPSIGPIAIHGAIARINDAYRACGINMPHAPTLTPDILKEVKGRGIVIAPPSAAGNIAWVRKLSGKNGLSDAFASGWMRVRGKRRWRSFDRGFVLSDHADWAGLLAAIHAAGASSVGVTHGSAAALARWLGEQGLHSFVVPTRYEGESLEESEDVPPTLPRQIDRTDNSSEISPEERSS